MLVNKTEAVEAFAVPVKRSSGYEGQQQSGSGFMQLAARAQILLSFSNEAMKILAICYRVGES